MPTKEEIQREQIRREQIRREQQRRQGGGAPAVAAAPAADPYANVGLNRSGGPGVYQQSPAGVGRFLYDAGKVGADAYTYGLADVAGGAGGRTSQARENLGGLGTGIELAASVASPALLAKVPVAAFKGAKTLYRGAESGAGSALDAYTHGAPLSSLPGEFVKGAGISEAIAQVTKPISKWWARRQNIANQKYKDTGELKADEKAKYKEVDTSGVKFQARDLRKLHAQLNNMDLVPGIDDPAINVLKKLEKDWTGADMSPAELDSVRQFVRKKLGSDPRQKSVAAEMISGMDKFSAQTPVVKPSATGIGPPAPAPSVNKTLLEARDLHARRQRLLEVERMEKKAERQARTGRFNPFAPSLESARVKKASALNEKIEEGKSKSQYTPKEKKALTQLEHGTLRRNVGGIAEHLSFSGGLGGPLSALSQFVPGLNVASPVVSAGAEALHQFGQRATTRELQDLKALIRDPTGKGIAPTADQIGLIKDRIAKLMAAGYRTQNRQDGGPR